MVLMAPTALMVLMAPQGLQGDPGAPGKNGADGKRGPIGMSPYDLYASTTTDSPVMSKSDWLKSLKGATGKDGAPGKDGVDGKRGPTGHVRLRPVRLNHYGQPRDEQE